MTRAVLLIIVTIVLFLAVLAVLVLNFPVLQ